mgnify:CR=1 FL=1
MKFAQKRRATGRNRQCDRLGLIAAARDAFDDLGPAASLADIAGWAGIDVATLRRQFRDRDELIDAVLDDLAASLSDDGGAESATRAPVAIPRIPLRQVIPPVAVIAALLPLGSAPTAAAAVEEPAPATVLTVSPLWPVVPLNGALGGSLCQSNSCASVPYMPFFTRGGVKALDNRLAASTALTLSAGGGATIVVGYSNGALVAERWLAEHADAPGEPPPDELSFVLIGNPRRAYGGSMPALPPTDYHVIDIVQQYDPLADFPDRPNLLALANVAAGIFSPLHLNYYRVKLEDPANTVWTEGNTTYVFVPTENLPLLARLRLMGMNKLADALNEPLKEIVERAYDRPYLTPPPEEQTNQTTATDQQATAAAAVQTAAAETAGDDAAAEPVSRKPAHRLTSTRHDAQDARETTEATDTSEASGRSDTPDDSSTGGATPQTRKAPHKRGLLHRSTG